MSDSEEVDDMAVDAARSPRDLEKVKLNIGILQKTSTPPYLGNETNWILFPKELQELILSFLDTHSLIECRLVCLTWRRLTINVPHLLVLSLGCTDHNLEALDAIFPLIRAVYVRSADHAKLLSVDGWNLIQHRNWKLIILDTDPASLFAQLQWFEDRKKNSNLDRVAIQFAHRLVQVFGDEQSRKPLKANSFYKRAMLNRSLGRLSEAVEDCKAALKLEPDNHSRWNYLGNMYVEMRQWAAALEAIQKAVNLCPEQHIYLFNRSYPLLKVGRIEEALSDATNCELAAPDDEWIHMRKATILAAMKRYDEAIASVSRAIAIEPKEELFRRRRAEIYSEMRNYVAAIADFDLYIQAKPTEIGARTDRGRALEKVGRYPEALQDFTVAIDVSQRSPSSEEQDGVVWENRGLAYEKVGKYQEALQDFSMAIKICPNDSDFVYDYGRVLFHMGRYEEALAHFNRALSIESDVAAFFLRKAKTLEKLGRAAEAQRSFERVLVSRIKDPRDHFAVAMALQALGNHMAALEKFDVALKLASQPEYYSGKAKSLLAVGRLEESLSNYRISLQINSNQPEVQQEMKVVEEKLRSPSRLQEH